MIGLFIGMAVVVLFGLYRLRPLRIIPHGVTGVLEVFGGKGTAVPPGIHFGWQFAVGKLSLYSSRQQRSDPGAVQVSSADNVLLGVDIAWTYRITDPIVYHYNSGIAQTAFYADVMAALRSACQQRTATELASDTNWMNERIREILRESEKHSGMQLDHVIVERVDLPVEIANATKEYVANQRAAKARVIQARMESEAKSMELETQAMIQAHDLNMKLAMVQAEQERATLTHQADLERQRTQANLANSMARERMDQEATRYTIIYKAFEKDPLLMRGFLEHETWKQRGGANTTIYTSPNLVSRPLYALSSSDNTPSE